MKHLFRTVAPGLLSLALPLLSQTATAQAMTTPTGESSTVSLNRLDQDMRTVVFLWDAVKGTPLEELTPQDARQQIPVQEAAKLLARNSGVAMKPTPVGKVIDGMTITSQGGVQIPIRIFVPAGTGPFPVVVYYHGGGFVVATNDTYDESARHLCDDANAIVVEVEYRKAPEAPFPAAYYDALYSYLWTTQHIAAYGGNPNKVAVAGESAGGNLAAEMAIAGRDGLIPRPTAQLLVYPETTTNINQPSDLQFTSNQLPLYYAELPYFNGFYVPAGTSMSDPRLAPINNNLQNLPPATIIAAEVDPLVSDGQDYYAALQKAGSPVTYQMYTGVTHEFFGLGAVVSKARQAELFGAAQLAASFK